MSNNFGTKSYGRIFIMNGTKEEVEDIIKGMDKYEFNYMPEDIVVEFDETNIYLVYTYKFDALDLDLLIEKCREKEIEIKVCHGSPLTEFDQSTDDYHFNLKAFKSELAFDLLKRIKNPSKEVVDAMRLLHQA
jgi:hypothetical protein